MLLNSTCCVPNFLPSYILCTIILRSDTKTSLFCTPKLVDLLKVARGPWSVSPGCKIRHRLQTCSCFLFKNIMTAFVLSLLFTKLIAIILHTGTYTKVN